MRKQLTSLLLTFVMVISLALPGSVNASELNEADLSAESRQTENEGTMNPSLDSPLGDKDISSSKQEPGGNPEDMTVEDSDVPKASEPTENGSIMESPSEGTTDSGELDNKPEGDVAATDFPADNPENVELPGVNESIENGEADMAAPAASSNISYPQMTGYYLVSVSGTVIDPIDGKPYPVKEDCNRAEQESYLTTTYVTKNEFINSEPVVLTFFHQGIGKSGNIIKPGPGYFTVNGPGYNSIVGANNVVLAYYTDTTVSQIDPTITEIYLSSSMKEQ